MTGTTEDRSFGYRFGIPRKLVSINFVGRGSGFLSVTVGIVPSKTRCRSAAEDSAHDDGERRKEKGRRLVFQIWAVAPRTRCLKEPRELVEDVKV